MDTVVRSSQFLKDPAEYFAGDVKDVMDVSANAPDAMVVSSSALLTVFNDEHPLNASVPTLVTWSRLAVVSVVHFSKAPSPIVVVEVVLVVVKNTLEALMLVNAPSAMDIPTWMETAKVPVPKISAGE